MKVTRVFVEYSVPEYGRNDSFQITLEPYPKVMFFKHTGEYNLSFEEISLIVEAIRLMIPHFLNQGHSLWFQQKQ